MSTTNQKDKKLNSWQKVSNKFPQFDEGQLLLYLNRESESAEMGFRLNRVATITTENKWLHQAKQPHIENIAYYVYLTTASQNNLHLDSFLAQHL